MSRRGKAKSRYAVPDLGQPVNRRPARVADTIKSELAVLVLQEMRDPRVSGVTISKVDVTRDLRTAIVYFSCADSQIEKAAEGLASAQGFMRSYLAKQLSLRYMPKLVFKHDLTVSRHEEMNKLFKEIESERQSSQ